ncbi:DUF4020 domain-containing protein [Mycobacterium sp. 134]|uniref:DUF4020 domain-containing protein n=1 Tax=Mycobacterium sp. 134 TaxID=3400425 RepID=UPI003AAC64B7
MELLMAWYGEVEIPDDLVEAQQKGELVLFVGAGASIGPPSNLPGFWHLAEIIRDESELGEAIGKLDGQALDEVLGRIDHDYDVDVHLRAAELLSPTGSSPNRLHHAIAALAQSSCARVVTTNYDRHLSAAFGQDVSEYVAPALPVGNDFHGLVYLHGALPKQPEQSAPGRLIITARDFGVAYLTEAWAARFLERMFATYSTLFIGYSHDDVIMKYLARGLGSQAKPRYILTDKPESDDWNQLNIVAIEYSPDRGHLALCEAIEKWATRSQGGLLARQRHIEQIVKSVRPQDLSAEQRSSVEVTVADEKSVRFFCDYADGKDWLDWISQQSAFQLLFDTNVASTVVSWRLATWFARTYVTVEMSEHALAVVRAAGGHLGSDLWDAIARQLSSVSRGQSVPVTLLSWIALLIRDAPQNEPYLDVMLSRSSMPAKSPAAVALFAYLTEPQLRLAPYLFGRSHFEIRFRGNDHWLREAWDGVFKPCFPEVAPDLLAVVDQQLRRAQRDISLANGPGSASELVSMRGAIASIGDQDYPDSLDLLIDFARDCIESMLDTESSRAGSQLAAWADSDVPLLRRLALHGWTHRTDVEVAAKIEWLSTLRWMLDYPYETEVVPLLVQASRASATAVDGLIAHLVAGADDGEYSARRAFRFLHMLREHSPYAASADQAIATLLGRHPDLRRFVEPAVEVSARQPLAPTHEELQDLVESDPASAVRAVQAQAEQEPEIRSYTWYESASQLTPIVQARPALGFTLSHAVEGVEEQLRSAVIGAVVRGWSQCSVDSVTAERIVAHLGNLDLNGVVGDVALMLMPRNAEEGQPDWCSVAGTKQLADKCWSIVERRSQDPSSDDWVHAAINHPAGQLALFWIRVLEDQAEEDHAWNGLPPDLATRFESMLQAGDGRSDMAQVVFARAIGLMHQLDPVWCEQHLLPLFAWDPPDRANRVWSGFLSGGRVTDSLLNAGMMESVLTAAAHRHDLPKRYSESLFGLCASMALKSKIEPGAWIGKFMRNCDLEARVAWANRIAEGLASMSSAEVEAQWNRWMKTFWRNRLASVPRKINFEEASAMAAWVVYLTDSASVGVELALKYPAGFTERTRIMHRLSEERIRYAPSDFACLVIHLLTNTRLPFYGFDLPELVARFRSAGVSEVFLTQLEERALHLGIVVSEL